MAPRCWIRRKFTPRSVATIQPGSCEEDLYGKTGPVPGLRLLLQQNSRTFAFRVRYAAVLSGLSASRTPDGLDP